MNQNILYPKVRIQRLIDLGKKEPRSLLDRVPLSLFETIQASKRILLPGTEAGMSVITAIWEAEGTQTEDYLDNLARPCLDIFKKG